MRAVPLRQSVHDRLTALEQRADKHDLMVSQVTEIYTFFKNAKMALRIFSFFWVKVVGGFFGVLGAAAVVLTIWEKLGLIFHH